MRRNILFASGMCILLGFGSAQAITPELHTKHSAQLEALTQQIAEHHALGSISSAAKEYLLAKVNGFKGHNFDLHVTSFGEDSVKNHTETLFYSQKHDEFVKGINAELVKKITQ